MRKTMTVGTDLLILLICLWTALLNIPSLFGCRLECVISGSMEPAIPTGALICVKKSSFEDIEVEDVITYWLADGKTKVTHRVVEKDTAGMSFMTKGDSNRTADAAPVEYSRTEGRVIWSVPGLGRIALLLTKTEGKAALALFLLLLYLLRNPWSAHGKERRSE